MTAVLAGRPAGQVIITLQSFTRMPCKCQTIGLKRNSAHQPPMLNFLHGIANADSGTVPRPARPNTRHAHAPKPFDAS